MNFNGSGHNILRKPFLILLMMAVPAFAFGQHKTEPSAPSHSAPSHASAPSHSTQSHTSAPSHTAPTSHGASTPSHTAGSTTHGNGTANHGTTNTNHASTSPARGTANGRTAGSSTHGAANTNHGAANTGHGAANGNRGVTSASRTTATSHSAPGRQVSLKGGGSASIRPNGQIRSINRNGMQIQHGMHGSRTVVTTHNGARIVTTGAHGGYVQRAYVTRGGRSYYSRTYYSNGVYRTGVYRGYFYGGRPYYGYSPGFYFHAGYYGWAYNPWVSPVYWGWGWGGAPWYGFYGGYFAPYPVYPSAAFWLTDYLIASNLQAAYAAQAEVADSANAPAPDDNQVAGGGAAPSGNTQVALTPEVKQAIAEEVKAQIAAEQAAAPTASAAPASSGQAPAPASGEVPPALDPARRTFVVSSDIAVVADGQECGLTAGDVITRLTDTPDADQKVNASVASSKKSDCAAGKTVAVSVDDLQEMQNHFQEQIDEGLKTLAAKQGTGGLPKAPDTATVPSDVPPPPPDTTAAKTLEDQQKAADQTESEVKQEAASPSSGGIQ